MVIGPNYVYIALPRTASQSMTSWLCEHHGGVLRGDLYHTAEIPPAHRDKYTFTTVRDPYQRMASLFRLVAQKFWTDPDEQMEETVGMTMAEFVHWCVSRSQPQWWPQTAILEGCRIDEILRYELLPGCLHWLPWLPPRRSSTFPHIDETEPGLIRAAAIQAINEHSEMDFDAYGYRKQL